MQHFQGAILGPLEKRGITVPLTPRDRRDFPEVKVTFPQSLLLTLP